MAIANISDSIEELCQSLEQSLSEFEPLDAHEDSLAVNIDIFRNDVVPAMESLKAVFTNAEDSVVAASSIYLKENVSDLSSIPADIKESLLQVFLLCGSENSITDIASSIVTETLENCSRTGNFDEISKYVTNMITELRAGDFGKLFGDGCSSIISEASNILTSHLDGLSDAEKEKIIGSENGKGFFSYDVKEDGAIDKDSIKAISGMEFHEDGSITDKFGITFTGEVTGHIKEEDSGDAAHGKDIKKIKDTDDYKDNVNKIFKEWPADKEEWTKGQKELYEKTKQEMENYPAVKKALDDYIAGFTTIDEKVCLYFLRRLLSALYLP